MLITFEYPDTDIRFFLYTLSGQLIRKFSYRQDKKFKFPFQQLEGLRNWPLQATWILDILPYKDYYLVFMVQTINIQRPDQKNKISYLFVHEKGEIKHRMEAKIRFKTITPDAHLGGITLDKENDILKVVIYKLNVDQIETGERTGKASKSNEGR
jgi:hypothetical protein